MSGMPGRSGRRPKPLADHLADGTWRRDRHGPRPVNPAKWADVLPSTTPPSWQPDTEELASLGPDGRKFLGQVLDENTLDRFQGTLMLEAARTLDALTVWRVSAATDAKACQMTNLLTRTFASLCVQAKR
jgi:hypothetical protein